MCRVVLCECLNRTWENNTRLISELNVEACAILYYARLYLCVKRLNFHLSNA